MREGCYGGEKSRIAHACSALGVAVAGLVGQQLQLCPLAITSAPRRPCPSAPTSMGSPRGVPVPCALASATSVGGARADPQRRAQQRALRGAVGRREAAGAPVLRAGSRPELPPRTHASCLIASGVTGVPGRRTPVPLTA